MRALGPNGIERPDYSPGLPSFRLQDLTAINGAEHHQAHDALADVNATLDLARKVKKRQPRLFAYALRCRSKSFLRCFLTSNMVPFSDTFPVTCRLNITTQL